ncbi:hypothetical protein LCGC14_1235880 [marine sediment metagenome]|uniref:Uncharacterized protein n=1 Tax=marine sediment metagenome TaxID=412755 RepID=A0A0F9PBF3_9ZZZZ
MSEPDRIRISGADLPPKGLRVLREILASAGLTAATVTSGSRTPAQQAKVMYEMCRANGPDYLDRLYRRPGREVVSVYRRHADAPEPELLRLMTQAIDRLGPANVSKHCSAEHIAFDVAPSSIADADAFVRAAGAHPEVVQFIPPPADPGYHIVLRR